MLEARHAPFSSTTPKCSLKSRGPLPLVPKCCPSAPGTPPAAKSLFAKRAEKFVRACRQLHTQQALDARERTPRFRSCISFCHSFPIWSSLAAWSSHLTVGSYLFSPCSLLRSQPQWRWNYLVRNCNIKLLWGSVQVQNMLFFNANFGILIQTQPACIATLQTKNKNDVFKIVCVCVCTYLNEVQWKNVLLDKNRNI